MSYPVSRCLIVKAATGKEGAYERFREAMRTNLAAGHYTVNPCPHNPQCTASDEELQALQARLDEDLCQEPQPEPPAAA